MEIFNHDIWQAPLFTPQNTSNKPRIYVIPVFNAKGSGEYTRLSPRSGFCCIQLHHSVFLGDKAPMPVSQFWPHWTILCCMSCPVHCRKFNSTPSLYSLTEPLFQLWQSKISPDFAKYPLEGRITLLLLWEPLFFFFLPHFMTCWNLSFPARGRTDGPCFGSTAS